GFAQRTRTRGWRKGSGKRPSHCREKLHGRERETPATRPLRFWTLGGSPRSPQCPSTRKWKELTTVAIPQRNAWWNGHGHCREELHSREREIPLPGHCILESTSAWPTATWGNWGDRLDSPDVLDPSRSPPMFLIWFDAPDRAHEVERSLGPEERRSVA